MSKFNFEEFGSKESDPKEFDLKRRLINEAAELLPFDKILQERAEWLIDEMSIEKYLKKDGEYLDVGAGMGHIIQQILEDMGKQEKPLRGYYGIDIGAKPLRKVQRREQARREEKNSKNPMNFSWATAESLPFKDQSLDGVSCIFSIHHMDKEKMDEVFKEAKRVIKQDGYIFIAEDIVGTEEQREITERNDRRLNWESKSAKHNYKGDQEWKEYFDNMGLELVDEKHFQSKSRKGPIPHGFYVLKLKDLK